MVPELLELILLGLRAIRRETTIVTIGKARSTEDEEVSKEH